MVNLTYTGNLPHEQPELRLAWQPGQTQTVGSAVAKALQIEYPGLYHEQTETEAAPEETQEMDSEQPAAEAEPAEETTE